MMRASSTIGSTFGMGFPSTFRSGSRAGAAGSPWSLKSAAIAMRVAASRRSGLRGTFPGIVLTIASNVDSILVPLPEFKLDAYLSLGPRVQGHPATLPKGSLVYPPERDGTGAAPISGGAS